MNNFLYQRGAVYRAATSNKEFREEFILSTCFNFRLHGKGNVSAFQPLRHCLANRLKYTDINGNICTNYTNGDYQNAIINTVLSLCPGNGRQSCSYTEHPLLALLATALQLDAILRKLHLYTYRYL
jgi:hypothetical protein